MFYNLEFLLTKSKLMQMWCLAPLIYQVDSMDHVSFCRLPGPLKQISILVTQGVNARGHMRSSMTQRPVKRVLQNKDLPNTGGLARMNQVSSSLSSQQGKSRFALVASRGLKTNTMPLFFPTNGPIMPVHNRIDRL